MSLAKAAVFQRYLVSRLSRPTAARVSRAMFSTAVMSEDLSSAGEMGVPREWHIEQQKVVPKPNFQTFDAPLPKTLVSAMQPTNRAVVLTESEPPYRVWNVNCAWQKLCGYSLTEARHLTLGSLLLNSEVDSIKAIDLVEKILRGEQEVEATLVNYKKCGRRFVDHIRIGPIYNKHGKLTHFVGVVEEVSQTNQ